MHTAISAGIGGVSNVFFYYIEQKIKGREVDPWDAAHAFAAGAISSGIGAAVPGLGSFGGFFNGFGGGIRGGMIFDGVGQIAANLVFGKDLRDGVAGNMLGGGIGGGLGKFMDLPPLSNAGALFDDMTGMFGDGAGTGVGLAEKGCGCE